MKPIDEVMKELLTRVASGGSISAMTRSKPPTGKRGDGWVSPTNARITHEEWKTLQKDEANCVVKEYDNGRVYVAVRWVGQVERINESFPDMWKVFRLCVFNYNAEGGTVPDPVMDGKWYPNQTAAIEAYETFLARWTDCEKSESGFVERDNDLTPPEPPPPPNPDAPTSDIGNVKGFEDDESGVW